MEMRHLSQKGKAAFWSTGCGERWGWEAASSLFPEGDVASRYGPGSLSWDPLGHGAAGLQGFHALCWACSAQWHGDGRCHLRPAGFMGHGDMGQCEGGGGGGGRWAKEEGKARSPPTLLAMFPSLAWYPVRYWQYSPC